MTQISLPPLTIAQSAIAQCDSRRIVWAAGRRAGKTKYGSVATHRVAARGGHAWWVARTYKVGANGWNYIRALAVQIKKKVVPKLCIYDSEPYTIEYPNGGYIQVRAVGDNPNDLRGEGLDLVVIDEAAYMPLKEVWKILQPALLDRNGQAVFISSPFGRNFFYDLWRWGDPENPNKKKHWQSFRSTSYDNPFLTEEAMSMLVEDMDEVDIMQEIYAQFIEGTGLVFRKIKDAISVPHNLPYNPKHSYSMGIDWGRVHDDTVIAVVDRSTQELVDITGFTKIDYKAQRQLIHEKAAQWQPEIIWAEENSMGRPNIETLEEEGLPIRGFVTSFTSKGPLIQSLALAIERKDIGLMDDKILIGQLTDYTQVPLPSGLGYKYSAPPGGKDDYVVGLALAWHGVRYLPGAGTGEAEDMPDELEAIWGGFG